MLGDLNTIASGFSSGGTSSSARKQYSRSVLSLHTQLVFGINTCIGKFHRSLPVSWKFPSLGWVKINTDETARGYPSLTTCGGIFRGSMREFIGAFSVFLEVQTTMVVEFYGVIHVLEETQKTGLNNVWLECDYALVCVAFTVRTNVPWMLRNR